MSKLAVRLTDVTGIPAPAAGASQASNAKPYVVFKLAVSGDATGSADVRSPVAPAPSDTSAPMPSQVYSFGDFETIFAPVEADGRHTIEVQLWSDDADAYPQAIASGTIAIDKAGPIGTSGGEWSAASEVALGSDGVKISLRYKPDWAAPVEPAAPAAGAKAEPASEPAAAPKDEKDAAADSKEPEPASADEAKGDEPKPADDSTTAAATDADAKPADEDAPAKSPTPPSSRKSSAAAASTPAKSSAASSRKPSKSGSDAPPPQEVEAKAEPAGKEKEKETKPASAQETKEEEPKEPAPPKMENRSRRAPSKLSATASQPIPPGDYRLLSTVPNPPSSSFTARRNEPRIRTAVEGPSPNKYYHELSWDRPAARMAPLTPRSKPVKQQPAPPMLDVRPKWGEHPVSFGFRPLGTSADKKASDASPGPGVYSPAGFSMSHTIDTKNRMSTAKCTFGTRRLMAKPNNVPGPASYSGDVIGGTPARDQPGARMAGRVKPLQPYATPGPGEYTLRGIGDDVHGTIPMTMKGRLAHPMDSKLAEFEAAKTSCPRLPNRTMRARPRL